MVFIALCVIGTSQTKPLFEDITFTSLKLKTDWDVLGAKGRFSFDCKWYACLKSNYEFDNTFDSANLWKDLKGRYNNLKDGLKELVGLHRRSADTIGSILSQPFMERAQLILKRTHGTDI